MIPRTVASSTATLEWDAVARPIPGEQVPGDRAAVVFGAEHVLAAAIDGLGHGPQAATAAQAAVAVLQRSAGQDPAAIVRECHRALQGTRGAALSLASIDVGNQTMTWLGVGNVEARLLHRAGSAVASESLLLHGGIVGHELPRLSAQTTKITRGDVLIFATDGIRRDYADDLVPTGTCHEVARRILDQHALGSDDALVLVARYLAR